MGFYRKKNLHSGLKANEIHASYYKHHKVSFSFSFIFDRKYVCFGDILQSSYQSQQLSKIAHISLVCNSGHTSFVTLVSLKQNQEIFGEKQAFTISDENQSVHAMPISSVHAYVKPCVTCSAERQN